MPHDPFQLTFVELFSRAAWARTWQGAVHPSHTLRNGDDGAVATDFKRSGTRVGLGVLTLFSWQAGGSHFQRDPTARQMQVTPEATYAAKCGEPPCTGGGQREGPSAVARLLRHLRMLRAPHGMRRPRLEEES